MDSVSKEDFDKKLSNLSRMWDEIDSENCSKYLRYKNKSFQ